MTTLHDLLKDSHTDRSEQRPGVDLRGRYHKIGLSAVAAAAPYRSAAEDCKTDRKDYRSATREQTPR